MRMVDYVCLHVVYLYSFHIMLIPNCTYICLYTCHRFSKQREWDSWAITWFNPHKPCPQSRALCGTVCALSITVVLYLIDPFVACLFYLYYLVMCFVF